MFLPVLCLLFLVPAVCASCYYVGLAVVAFLPTRARRPAVEGRECTFAIVIPAHNEERGIARTVRSCSELDYPRDKYQVYVVADNCTDRTAEVAVKESACCLVRNDNSLRGKGAALEWAFRRILTNAPDAVVVLDADCRLDRHALRAFSHCLTAGSQALQANDVASNPDESSLSYIAAVANTVENDLFYAPKTVLGLAVFLRGTGMVLRRDVLERYPWEARSVTEDAEYSLRLLTEGIHIEFVPDVYVRSEFPSGHKELRVQRARWVGGTVRFGKAFALKLIWQGLCGRRLVVLDAGWTLLVVVRSLVLLVCLLAAALGLLSAWLTPGPLSLTLGWAGLATLLAQLAYFGLGVLRLGLSPRRLRLLLGSPVAASQMFSAALIGTCRAPTSWLRTHRPSQ